MCTVDKTGCFCDLSCNEFEVNNLKELRLQI